FSSGRASGCAAAIAAAHPDARPLENVREAPGAGVEAEIDGVTARLGSPAFCGCEKLAAERAALAPEASLVAVRLGEACAVLDIRQALRRDARAVIDELRAAGLKVVLLSGDRRAAVAAVAGELGVTDWWAQMRPGDKIAVLESLDAKGQGGKGHGVLMVSDGINDAPSLASAHVSLSPISAADVTRAQADAVFLGERLAPVVLALKVARRARHLMRQNLMIAVIYNLIAVPLAVAGYVTPLVAALAMSGSSVIVTLNALRARQGGFAAGEKEAA
ncbi:MAG: HAD family hydrolase, partial [Starkeya sp.]|nr:HAD family hydrolase [Starkeya sp.]